jgi:hypothetical protein
VRLHLSAGQSAVEVRAVGYYTPRAAGGSYLKVVPATRLTTTTVGNTATSLNMNGRAGSSAFGAVAYLLDLHPSEPTAAGVLSVGSFAAGAPLAPTAAFTTTDASGAAVTTPDPYGSLRLATSAGQVSVPVDLTGWYVG